MPISSREVIRRLRADGWELVRTTGSHHHFRHPSKRGLVTIAHPQRDMKAGTLRKHRASKWPEVAKGLSMAVRHYPALVEGDAGSGYTVFFPDLPGCMSGGDTLQAAALNAEEALAAHIGLMMEAGEPVPEPSRLDDLPRPVEPDVVEQSRLLVRVGVRDKVHASPQPLRYWIVSAGPLRSRHCHAPHVRRPTW